MEKYLTTNNELRRPDYFNFATDVVDVWAAKSPSLEAMLWVSSDTKIPKSLSYSHFSRQSHRIAALLQRLGVSSGDVMMLVLPRLPAWWEVATAELRSGVVIAPATTLLTAADIRYRCRKSKASVFVGDATNVAKARQIRHSCPSLQVIIQVDGTPDLGVVNLYDELRRIADDAIYHTVRQPWNAPALAYFTSGTSGLPKMVRHNQVSYPLGKLHPSCPHVLTGKYWLRLSPGKLCWNFTEQGWGKAAYSFFGAWNCGASLFIWDDRGSFNAQSILNVLHRFPITSLCAPPLAWRHLTTNTAYMQYYRQHPPKSFSHCTSAGDYGDFPVRTGSMGKPLPGVPLHAITASGEETAPGEEGELAILLSDDGCGRPGESGFMGIYDGYVGDDGRVTRTSKVTCSRGRKQIWYMTGDKARRDADGYLWFVGRADDVINSSGYRIGPFEVESILMQHPAVAECAVISSPDKARGEVVKAIIVLASEYAAAELDNLTREIQDFCKKISAPYKYPRTIQYASAGSLPRTTSGKIKRAQLRKKEWEAVRIGQI
ncbi:hypothetical protein BDW74DRAFT_187461 [Aspergillus multicolor]|uniref:uncharacterized protein n=1 Tax=Aspergillus multicolor TaxID=41759 RepID=UPI003CCD3856